MTEVARVLSRRVGVRAEARFLSDLATGAYSVDGVAYSDWARIAELVWRYRDLRLGTFDASVIAASERLAITTVATVDRRHFGVVVPAHVPRLTLLP